MPGGNTSRVVVWVADTVILKKPLASSTYYYVADAETGRPVPHANVEFFGYQVRYEQNAPPRISTQNFAEFTDPDGQVVSSKLTPNYQWVSVARTPEGRFAYLGFSNVWYNPGHDARYDQVKAYGITDRPAYRPKGTVKFKVWVRHARYDEPDASEFAGRTFHFEIRNPKGEKVLEKDLKADAFGGFDGELPLPSDAALGVYNMLIDPGKPTGLAAGSFRVEEYKKPEFEVTVDAPHRHRHARRQGQGDPPRQVLFRHARHPGEGQVQGHAHLVRTVLVPPRPLGLALRPRLFLVRQRLHVVPRLVALGLHAADLPVVGARLEPARGHRRRRGHHRRRRHRHRRDRPRPGPGPPGRPGPQVPDRRRGHRPVAPDDRRQR